ncbi:hypothetical protein DYB37_013337 [Aphanomyces astaci]|uniref:Uncharacterized protein n=1 Tax=Aphanomyces astaci TaxID=112090 RepID=A0A3R7ARG8_APHAT|nr:hypothetical protein DYB37_013337 [Aphanomyces astaci]
MRQRLQAVLELPLMQDVRILDCFAVKPSMIMLVSLSDGFSVVNSSPGGVYRDVLTLLAFFSSTALPFTADVYWSATVMIIEWSDDVLVGHYAEGATVVPVAPALVLKPPRQYSRKRSVSFFKAGKDG